MSDEEEIFCYKCNIILTNENNFGRACICGECQVKYAEHPQILTRHGFYVDEKLVDIINTICDNDIKTTNSCQNNNNTIWIAFDGLTDVKKLYKLFEKDADFIHFLNRDVEWRIVPDYDDVHNAILHPYSYFYSLRFPCSELDYFEAKILSLL